MMRGVASQDRGGIELQHDLHGHQHTQVFFQPGIVAQKRALPSNNFQQVDAGLVAREP